MLLPGAEATPAVSTGDRRLLQPDGWLTTNPSQCLTRPRSCRPFWPRPRHRLLLRRLPRLRPDRGTAAQRGHPQVRAPVTYRVRAAGQQPAPLVAVARSSGGPQGSRPPQQLQSRTRAGHIRQALTATGRPASRRAWFRRRPRRTGRHHRRVPAGRPWRAAWSGRRARRRASPARPGAAVREVLSIRSLQVRAGPRRGGRYATTGRCLRRGGEVPCTTRWAPSTPSSGLATG